MCSSRWAPIPAGTPRFRFGAPRSSTCATLPAQEVAATLGQVDFSFPALTQSQPDRDNGGWSAVKVFYATVVDPGSARVAARLADGTPLLLDKQIGEGHMLLLTSGLDNLTNDLPLHPVFVAFVDHTARYLSGTERLSGSRLVDSFVQLRSSAEPVGALANVEVIDPDGHRPLSLERSAHRTIFPPCTRGLLSDPFCQWPRCRHRRQSGPARVEPRAPPA